MTAPADVKKAYRKLARQHHPDRNNAGGIFRCEAGTRAAPAVG